MTEKRNDKLEIWVKYNEMLILYKPQSFELDRHFIDEFREEIKISWIEDQKFIFDESQIDKRCKSPIAIIRNLVKKLVRE